MKVLVIFSIIVLISIVILSTSSNVESIPIDRIITKDSAGNQITPVLNQEVFFHYNVQNYGNQSQTYDLDISVNNEDTNTTIYYKKMQLTLEANESKPIVWSFTPTVYGNYNGKITKNEITLVNSFSINDYSDTNDANYNSLILISPLQQINLGVQPDHVKCKPNLVLIQKYDGSPACVMESTKQKLIERGWTTGEQNPEPEPEPKPMPEAQELQRQMKLTALNEVQQILQTDYGENEIKINAIKEYTDKFESDFFMKQFLFALKDQYKKDDMINFTFTEWGYQKQECTSPVLKVYLKPYDNYTAFGSIQKIYEWKNPNHCVSLKSFSDGYLILNFWRMPDFPEQYRSCTVPGEYKIFASSMPDENPEPVGSFTCQREMLEGEPQPWMEIPE